MEKFQFMEIILELLKQFKKIVSGYSYEDFKKRNSGEPGFRDFKKAMFEDHYQSFLWNSFSFTDVDLPPKFLDLSFLSDDYREKQKSYFTSFYRNYGKKNKIKKYRFPEMMLTNFSRDRFNFENHRGSLKEYLIVLNSVVSGKKNKPGCPFEELARYVYF